jgi:hypothetical protein
VIFNEQNLGVAFVDELFLMHIYLKQDRLALFEYLTKSFPMLYYFLLSLTFCDPKF